MEWRRPLKLIHVATLLHSWGSPIGAVGLALRAANDVKLDRARLELMGDTADCFNWTLIVG